MWILPLLYTIIWQIAAYISKYLQNKDDQKSQKRTLLVTAHPDDECMFFSPTVSAIKPGKLVVLCLSAGNAEGIGAIREKELVNSCSALGISKENIVQVNNQQELADSMDMKWDPDIVLRYVTPVIDKFKIEQV